MQGALFLKNVVLYTCKGNLETSKIVSLGIVATWIYYKGHGETLLKNHGWIEAQEENSDKNYGFIGAQRSILPLHLYPPVCFYIVMIKTARFILRRLVRNLQPWFVEGFLWFYGIQPYKNFRDLKNAFSFDRGAQRSGYFDGDEVAVERKTRRPHYGCSPNSYFLRYCHSSLHLHWMKITPGRGIGLNKYII